MALDKQYVREYLNRIAWDRNPPAPQLPDEQVVRPTGATGACTTADGEGAIPEL